jgi:hypothetical protein
MGSHMAKLDLKRHFADLLPHARNLVRSARRFLYRTSIGGVSVLSLGSGTIGAESQYLPQGQSIRALVADRPRKASLASKLILTVRTSAGHVLSFAQHRSHSSHSSHGSHGSHSSHYSSRGIPAPAPMPSPAPAPPPPAPLYQPPAGTADEAPLQSTPVKLTTVDRKEKSVTGKDGKGTARTFYFTPETRLRTIDPAGVTTPFVLPYTDEVAPFPILLPRDVIVKWRVDPRSGKVTAAEFILYE